MSAADLPVENAPAYELLLAVDEARVMHRGEADPKLLAVLVDLKLVVVDATTGAIELTRAGLALAWGCYDAQPTGEGDYDFDAAAKAHGVDLDAVTAPDAEHGPCRPGCPLHDDLVDLAPADERARVWSRVDAEVEAKRAAHREEGDR